MSGPPAPVDAVIERFAALFAGWSRDTTPAAMRADWDAFFAARGEASREPVRAGNVPAWWLRAPGARDDRVVLYLHGGGFQVGSPASHDELAARVSAAAGARLLLPAYRLAPEHRFPAALDDAAAAYGWLLAQRVPPGRIALVGDSAGGGLVLSLLLRLNAERVALPAAAWTMSAWTDMTASGSAYATRAAVDPINQRPKILAMARNYLGRDADPAQPFASAAFATRDQLAGLPPILLQAGDREVVLSDSEDFAARAREAGVPVELQVWPGMIHVFQQFPAELADAREALAAGGRFLADRFAHATPG